MVNLDDSDQDKSKIAAYSSNFERGQRRFGVMNWLGVFTLLRREIMRFLKVYIQTLLAPVVTAGLFLTVFALALSGGRAPINNLSYVEFLAPGLVMMTVIQNAFANTSSSMMIAKMQGTIFDTLTPPLSSVELTLGIVGGGVARGCMVGLFACLVLFPFVGVGAAEPLWALFFIFIASALLGLLGVIAGIWAVKIDQMAAVTNFVIMPLSFLSGTFYEAARLPEPWWTISHFNPFFYLIDGFRFGVLGQSEASPWLGAAVGLSAVLLLWVVCWRLFETGYRLKP